MNSQILPLDMCLSFKRAIKESPILWMKPSYKFLEKAGDEISKLVQPIEIHPGLMINRKSQR